MTLFNRNKKKRLGTRSLHQGVALITDYDAFGPISEEYRTLRTNISFSKADGVLKTIAVTSDSSSEGKSTVSANLAVTFANQEQKTILVDLDMRKPTVHATFGIQNTSGLVNLLTDPVKDLEMLLTSYCKESGIDNLMILTSGPTPPNPSELLGSKRMETLLVALSKHYDRIILDTPPVISVTDAQIIASRADATILVVPYGIAQKAAVIDAKLLLQKVHANIIGVVLNRVPTTERSGYYYGGYYK
ncbi:CpsD/CapB family tyrosine-protein kinase [Lacticaseibacillus paracasei]|uniref:CpsD/CapB family tyrosine-protein kinase n=1 Tax=Lacticaseibacillus paracasei TaxID=1597 RepID=UPI000FEF111D|nr:CpsD/CapB family tyrosine-protein kinase [Lacticaseibacillus paracasei]RWZ67205.1 polysaccharide biosynthesis tyrosine autokinase [Lacticaseibacillus paracasei]